MSDQSFRFARFAVASVLAAAICGCSSEAKKTRLLGQAETFFKAGDYDKAEIEYKNVLQIAGLEPAAVAHLGIIYFEQGRFARAATYLYKARELQPENLEVRLKLGYFSLVTGKPAEAWEAANFILEKQPQHTEAAILLAEAVAQPKDVLEARRTLQTIVASSPGSIAALTALGLLDLRERKYLQAEAALERARLVDAKFNHLNSALGRLHWAKNDLIRAEKAFTAAAEASPPRSPTRLQTVQFHLQTGHTEVSRRMLEEIIQKAPDYLPAYVLLGNLLSSEKKYDDAIAQLDKALVREPDHPEALLLTAQIRLAKGEKEKALSILEKTVALFPQSPQVQYQLGAAQLANGNIGDATASFTLATKIAPGFQPAMLGLAQAHMRQGSYGQAVDTLKKLLQQNPTVGEARVLLAEAYRAQGNLDEAVALFRQLGEAAPRSPQVHVMTGTALLQQNKKKEARESFNKALEIAPDYLPALDQLVSLDLAEKQVAAAVTRLDAQISRNPKSGTLHLLLAKAHLAQPNYERAEAALSKTIELQPESPVAYLLLAQVYLTTNQQQKALTNLQLAAAKSPNDFGPVMMIGVLQEQQKNYAAARDSYEKAVAINPKAAGALNNLAYIYAEHFGELEKGYELAQKARDLLPNAGETGDTLGWILYKKRHYPRALPLLEASAAQLASNAEARFHLGMTYYMMGNEEGARKELEAALGLSKDFKGAEEARLSLDVLSTDSTKEPARATLESVLGRRKDDPVALARLAAIHEREGKSAQAIAAYETVLKANPENVNVALAAIRLYRRANENSKALELAKATRKLAPADARVAHVLGRLAYESRDFAWSASLLQEAARKQSADPELLFDLAEASYSIGLIHAAETAAREALQVGTGFSRAAQARTFLALLDIAANPGKTDGNLAAIDAALKTDPGHAPALMAKAAVHESKKELDLARQAYEQILTRYPDFSPAKRNLVILYAADAKDHPKALELVNKAREAFPTDAELAKAYSLILYRQGNYARASALLQEAARSLATDGEIMYYLGMSQRQLKDNAAGTRSLQRALELGLPAKLEADARKALSAAK